MFSSVLKGVRKLFLMWSPLMRRHLSQPRFSTNLQIPKLMTYQCATMLPLDQGFCVNQRFGISLKNTHFCLICGHFCIKILRKHATNMKKANFDHRLACTAPKRWSKYTTAVVILLINFHFHFKQYFKCPFEVESNGINNILPLLKC